VDRGETPRAPLRLAPWLLGMTAHTLILGIGNPLMADDGAGIGVIELLRRETLPAGVELRDGGTAGVGLVSELENVERLILIDCAKMAPPPGENGQVPPKPGSWRRLELEETRLLDGEATPLSLHDADLRDALRLAEALDVLPAKVIIYGIQPASVEWDRPMSAQVSAALPAVAQAVLQEIGKQVVGPQTGEGRHSRRLEV
jgi:hydrogenase maturation protease